MRTRQLGPSNLIVSEVGLGCNNLGGRINEAQSHAVVHAALDHGITFLDVADVYGRRDAHAGASEETLGRALKGRRNDIVLATKFGMKMDETRHGASRCYIAEAVEASLKRLQTDRIDLYQLHTPDPQTPIEETLRALDDLTKAGKIRYAGVSNMKAWQVVDAWHIARRENLPGFICTQDELSLIARDNLTDLVPALNHIGYSLLPYFPLASGMLTGKYRDGDEAPPESRLAAWTYLTPTYQTDANWRLIDRLRTVCDRFDRTLTELAFGWLLSNPTVGSVIAGATSPKQIADNVAAATKPLSQTERAALEAALPEQ